MRGWRVLVAGLLGVLLLAGCATFPDTGPRDWREKLEDAGELGGPPSVGGQRPGDPGQQGQPGQPGDPDQPPAQPRGCDDPDPLVVATCLEPVGAIAVSPDGLSALVAERTTGRVLRVERGKDPRLVATVAVDPAGGGGLTGLVLSPAYSEDHLLYAYATTTTDNRVLRISTGEPPEPILAGIPRGPRNNGGALGVDRTGALLVATGDAGGHPDASSPAGKVLRIDTLGRPAPGNPDPASPIYSSGLGAPGGMCANTDDAVTWVTDRRGDADVLQAVVAGDLGAPEWQWAERPGVAGCIATSNLVAVAQGDGKALFVLPAIHGVTFAGSPQKQIEDRYGRLSALCAGPGGTVWVGTANKAGGSPVSSDDRVFQLPLAGAGGGASAA